MTWMALCAIAMKLPEVELGSSYGTPALKLRGKLICRLKENGADVVFVTDGLDEKEALLATQPALYHTTDHYRGYPAVLARLAKLRVGPARERLEIGWRLVAPKRLLAAPAAKRER